MRTTALTIALLLLFGCAASGERDGARNETPITDFIEVNELAEVDVIRTLDQLVAKDINDTYLIVSTRREDYLLEYYSRCVRRYDGQVEPDVRRDARALYRGVDTFRGCRIKAIYALEPGQADELRDIGRAMSR